MSGLGFGYSDRDTIELELQEWNPRKMLRDRRMMILGKPGTGKTVAAFDVMYYMRNMQDGIILSPTDKYQGLWESVVPPVAVYQNYDREAIKKVIERQDKLFNERWQALLEESRRTGKKPRKDDVKIPPVFVVADDCMADDSLSKDPLIRVIFNNGRHLKIFLLITAQYMMDMPLSRRQMIDYLLVCKEDTAPILKRLHEYFFQTYIPDYYNFVEVVQQVTQDYGVLVFDRTNPRSSRIEDHLFFWHPTQREPYSYRIGCDEWWQYSDQNYAEIRNPPERKGLRYLEQKQRSRRPTVVVHRKGGAYVSDDDDDDAAGGAYTNEPEIIE